jgi:hypothetical protein
MNTEEALQASDTALQELATALRQGKSDSLLHYLSMLSRFHRYSFSNCMLISRSKTESADEADSAESTVRVLRGFRVVHVFDVSQTEGHELAHELLHQGADQPPSSKAVLETEAEAVAWVVCRACGLDCSTRAADYIQLWDGDEQTLLQSLERGPQRRHSTCDSEHCAATIMGILEEPHRGHSTCDSERCAATIAGILQVSSRLLTCCHPAAVPSWTQQGVGLEFESHLQRAVSPEDTMSISCVNLGSPHATLTTPPVR